MAPISTTVQVNCSLGKIDQLTTLKQNYSKANLLEWKRSPLTQRHFWESTAEENLMICKPSHLLTVVLGYYRRAEWEKSVTFKMSLQKGLPNLWMMSIVHLAIKCHFGKTFLPFSLDSSRQRFRLITIFKSWQQCLDAMGTVLSLLAFMIIRVSICHIGM